MARMGRDIAMRRHRAEAAEMDEARARVQAAEEERRIEKMAMPQTAMQDMATSIVPTQNPAALWSYYLGLFSLFPGIGAILMVIAIVQGGRALKLAAAYPQVKGRVHAVVGIVAGIIGGLISTTIFVLFIHAMVT